MPSFIKNPQDEARWEKAKQKAKEQGQAGNWAYVTAIYKSMSGGKVAAITWNWPEIEGLLGHSVVGVQLTDDHELAYLKFDHGTQAPVHLWQATVPVGATSVGRVASFINDPDVVQRAVGHTLIDASQVVPGVVEFLFDNGVKVGLHEDWTKAAARDDNPLTPDQMKEALNVWDKSAGFHYHSDNLDIDYVPGEKHWAYTRTDKNGTLVELRTGWDDDLSGSEETEKHIDDHGDKNPGKIPGGLAKAKKPSDFNSKALAKGMDVEKEHTTDLDVAMEIAMDHLTEDPEYYDKLEEVEKDAARLAARFIRRVLAEDSPKEITTETASVYVLAGNQLDKLIEDGEYKSALGSGDYNRGDRIILDLGGLVFHTGADGTYEIDVKPKKK